jgi:hypothetical protein
VQRHLSLTLSRERERTHDVPAQRLIFLETENKKARLLAAGLFYA